MEASKAEKGDLVARVEFPLYCVKMLNDRYFVVAGGGGAAKTGVANGFSIHKLSFDGSKCSASELVKYSTGSKAVMNCASFQNGSKMYFSAGQDAYCQLYRMIEKLETVPPTEEDISNVKTDTTEDEKGVKHRRRSKSGSSTKRNTSNVSNGVHKQLSLEVQPLDCILTDTSAKESAFQKVVRICRNGKLMATAGCDGYIHLWQFPSMKPLRDIKAHGKEVDDIDISPDGQKIVSVSRDLCAFIWSVKDAKKLCQLEWTPTNNAKYSFKRCRFGIVEDEKRRPNLYTIANPVTQSKFPSYIQRWDTGAFLLNQSVPVETSLSALAVSDDGRFLAVGTMFTGSVDIYISFNLQRLKHVPAAHATFVTGLDFVPNTLSGRAVTGDADAAVLSISVDNQVRLHRIPPPASMPVWLAALLIVSVLIVTFILCSWLGL